MTDLRHMSLFRDVQAALEFQQMAQESYLDTEFTMYGAVFWTGGQRHYLVSADEEKLIRFGQEAVFHKLQPMPAMSLTEVCPVPLGERERINQAVELRLAQQFAAAYPPAFLQAIRRLAERPNTNDAYSMLQKVYRWCKNTFDSDRITLARETQPDRLRYGTNARLSWISRKKLGWKAKASWSRPFSAHLLAQPANASCGDPRPAPALLRSAPKR